MTSTESKPPLRQGSVIPLLAVALLITYGSLYPFRFALPRKDLLTWQLSLTPGFFRDIVINLLMYCPLGFLACRLLGRLTGRAASFVLAILMGFSLSAAIECLQAFDLGRYSSAVDLVMNTAGTCLGAAAALVLRLELRPVLPIRRNPAIAVLLLCLLGSWVFPLIPRAHFAEWQAAAAFFRTAPFHPALIVFACVEWTVLRILLDSLLLRRVRTLEFLLLTLTIPARILISSQAPVWTEFAGALLAVALASRWRPSAAAFAPWFWLDIVALELFPFGRFSAPQPFGWMPFGASIIITGPSALAILLKKAFLYGAAILLPGRKLQVLTAALALLLFLLEWLQRFQPSRTAEITDPVMTVFMGIFLFFVRNRPAAEKEGLQRLRL